MAAAPLLIVGCGAITAVGLSSAQTCAAVRARLSGFQRCACLPPPQGPLCVGAVPAAPGLKKTATQWLLNLAEAALRDCLSGIARPVGRMALVLGLPEPFREHPALAHQRPGQFTRQLRSRLSSAIDGPCHVLEDGHGAAIRGAALARQLLASGEAAVCLVGGVDSLLNASDLRRLQLSGLLHDEGNPQGVVPGEGAAFVALSSQPLAHGPVWAQISGIGAAMEPDAILGERFSVGNALVKALNAAVADAGLGEPSLSFRVSDMNGERYRAWETLLASTRFYRTRRERMAVWHAAAFAGDTGAASAALGLIVAATGVARGYAPGPVAACESSSDLGLRAACIVTPAPGAAAPPFRSKTAWAT